MVAWWSFKHINIKNTFDSKYKHLHSNCTVSEWLKVPSRQSDLRNSFPLSRLCCSQSLGDILPVGNVPNCFDIIRTHILVLEIICMLPHINSKQWHQP